MFDLNFRVSRVLSDVNNAACGILTAHRLVFFIRYPRNMRQLDFFMYLVIVFLCCFWCAFQLWPIFMVRENSLCWNWHWSSSPVASELLFRTCVGVFPFQTSKITISLTLLPYINSVPKVKHKHMIAYLNERMAFAKVINWNRVDPVFLVYLLQPSITLSKKFIYHM